MNRVPTKKRLRCWASQGKSRFCKGGQSTWDLKPAHALGYRPGKLERPGQFWQVEQQKLVCQHQPGPSALSKACL